MNNNQKAVAQLEDIDIQAKEENDTVYVCIGDTSLELSRFEINYRAKEFDTEKEEEFNELEGL